MQNSKYIMKLNLSQHIIGLNGTVAEIELDEELDEDDDDEEDMLEELAAESGLPGALASGTHRT